MDWANPRDRPEGRSQNPSKPGGLSAIGVMASDLGGICGLSGFEHGLFEFLQGNVPIEGRVICAIGEANRFWQYGTEPAFTLIPSFLLTGILAMSVSLVLMLWAARFATLGGRNPYGGPVFILLSVAQFLVGGGIPQVGLAIVVGIAAIWINRPLTWGWASLPLRLRRVLAWPWLWLVLVLALTYCLAIVGAVFGVLPVVTEPDQVTKLLYVLLYLMEGLLPLMVISVLAHDSLRPIENQ